MFYSVLNMVPPSVRIPCRTFAASCLILLWAFLGEPLKAQMVPNIRAVGEAQELGLDRDHRSRDFTIQEIECSVPANVLWPGDRPVFKFRVTNNTAAPLSTGGILKVIHYGTRGKPGDIWEPLFYKIAEADSVPFRVDLAPHATGEIRVEPKIPETFGGYVLVAELAGHGHAFAASVVRAIEPDEGAVQFPSYALDLNGTSEEVACFFKRVGVKGARAEVNVFAVDDKDYGIGLCNSAGRSAKMK